MFLIPRIIVPLMIFVILFLGVTQVIVPLWRGEQTFAAFRKKRRRRKRQ